MKILTVVGARPQLIKAAALSRVLTDATGVQEVVVHTGQHYDPLLSDVFFRELGLREPDHHLGIGSASHGEQTGRMLEALEAVMMRENPAGVLVYGDTNSTIAGALAAAKLQLRVAHVEAGLRSGDRRMPEELNRIVTDHLSDLLFAPTASAEANLAAEGIPRQRVHLVGDVMYDAALHYGSYDPADRPSKRLPPEETYVLVTVHRAENTDDPVRLRCIMDALAEVAREVTVILPLHPRTRAALTRIEFERDTHGLSMVEPVGYLEMLALEKAAKLIVTDSGGVQKEAFFFRVPCITLRENTEWVELVESGWNRLAAPFEASTVAKQILLSLRSNPPAEAPELYGGGRASERIRNILLEAWG